MNKLIVFYTFNPTFVKSNDKIVDNDINILMLKMSIYSVNREIGEYVEIRVYTTKYELMKKILKSYPCKIISLKKKYIIGNKTNDYLTRFSDVGHARIFICKDILWKENRSCLYLDQDTGMIKNLGKKFYDTLIKLEEPFSWCIEKNHLLKNWCISSGIKDTDFWDKLNCNIEVRNNGVLYFPNNHIGRKISSVLQDIYFHLLKSYKKWNFGFDMTAISILWNDYKLKTFINNFPLSNLGILHYYSEKYNPFNEEYRNNIYINWDKILKNYEKNNNIILN